MDASQTIVAILIILVIAIHWALITVACCEVFEIKALVKKIEKQLENTKKEEGA